MLGNPSYNFTTINWDTNVDCARGKERPTDDAISGDYSAFATRGGKFLMYHCWAASFIAPVLTIDEHGSLKAGTV